MTLDEIYERAAREVWGDEYWGDMEPEAQLQAIASIRDSLEAVCFVLDTTPKVAIEKILKDTVTD